MNKQWILCFLIITFSVNALYSQTPLNTLQVLENPADEALALSANGKAAIITTDPGDAEVVRVAAKALAADIQLVSHSAGSASGISIIIGTLEKSKAIQTLIAQKKINPAPIKGKWESFMISVVKNVAPGGKQALVIAGSDPRGTAFGVFELSKRMGVSPFYWWADIRPKQKKSIYIKGSYISSAPSVKYRGIFLNDEDWGLQPWAAKTFEPETGDIGPKTYAKIFELLLRLKANLIWPAMHPSTKAFYHYPGNKKVAADYAIIVGSSHAEPMLRNNVGEWDKSMGDFNYLSNKERIQNYWETRVEESKGNDAIYTMGMRGVHDSGMEGVKNSKEAVPLLEKIIADQREMLRKHISPNPATVPQAFTVYKEVLEIYDNGIKLPEDITIVWPDDNYGYIQRLNNSKENSRKGGSGVYYHASYWGRPHDYLWLSSTHPGLIREEMMKAYETGSSKLWVLNVGDIKPLEYNVEMFLDMAYRADAFKDSRYISSHLKAWAANIFGADKAEKISNILSKYYQLAFERRPEFMGWSQTEPTTQTKYSDYNHFYYGDEAQRRLDEYERLVADVKSIQASIDKKDADAFYQLVYYPVAGASLINKKFLYRDKAFLYSKQNRSSAADYAELSKQAYKEIVRETEYYNNQLAEGKWKHMMSMSPRDLPVYKEPVLPEIKIESQEGWSIAPEGFVSKDSSLISRDSNQFSLPAFNRRSDKRFFVDLFLSADKGVNWTAQCDSWIKLSQRSGVLAAEPGKRDMRLWVSIDWDKIERNGRQNGKITFRGNGKIIELSVGANNTIPAALQNYKGAVEDNGLISIAASNVSRTVNKPKLSWQVLDNISRSGKGVAAMPFDAQLPDLSNLEALRLSQPSVEYDFYTLRPSSPNLKLWTLPTHPVNNNYRMRYAVSIDNGPMQIIDFKTVGRSEEWKQNVLRNAAVKDVKVQSLDAGKHILRIYMIDPGVILDRIVIDLGGYKKAYSSVPDSK